VRRSGRGYKRVLEPVRPRRKPWQGEVSYWPGVLSTYKRMKKMKFSSVLPGFLNIHCPLAPLTWHERGIRSSWSSSGEGCPTGVPARASGESLEGVGTPLFSVYRGRLVHREEAEPKQAPAERVTGEIPKRLHGVVMDLSGFSFTHD
jgi:hypothetical protein